MSRHTHRGHCQACGRQQAVSIGVGTLAKHGYAVAGFGYFHGTCGGSDRKPLEVERTYCDSVVASLRSYAAAMLLRAEELESGRVFPEQAKSGKRIEAEVPTTYPPFKRRTWTDEVVPFLEAPEWHREAAVRGAVSHHQSEARFATTHADDLLKLAEGVHGQPLIALKPAPAEIKVGDTVRVCGQVVVVTKIGYAHQGFSGRTVPHVYWERGGKEFKQAKRYARLV